LFWLIVRRHHQNEALLLSRNVFLTISAAFLAVITVFNGRALEARLIAAFGIALIPAALEIALQVCPRLSRVAHGFLYAAALCYLALPIAYGAVSVIGKIARTPAGYRSGPSGLYNPMFASSDAKSTIAQLAVDFQPDFDVWYLTEPITALDLPGRVIIRHADFLSAEKLNETFYTTQSVRVHLLLPPWFEQNGKGSIIRGEFPQASGWSSKTLSNMNYVEWTATLLPNRH